VALAILGGLTQREFRMFGASGEEGPTAETTLRSAEMKKPQPSAAGTCGTAGWCDKAALVFKAALVLNAALGSRK
jgi:hypothetical protein